MYKLIIIRHGESIWNFENRFTGWTDVPMTDHGREQTKNMAHLMTEHGFTFDVCYTSVLRRSVEASWQVLREMELEWLPIHKSWRMNERHYGDLQGQNKAEIAKKFGKEQVDTWRWNYHAVPPPLAKKDKRYPGHDRRYADLNQKLLPLSESLKNVEARVTPYWRNKIAKDIKKGKRVFISGHKNCLRALFKYIEGLSDDEVSQVDVPLGVVIVYEFDKNLKPVKKEFLEY
jgi:2,3-bisphosphoglycerate-dependent phosphoglycerate mutase